MNEWDGWMTRVIPHSHATNARTASGQPHRVRPAHTTIPAPRAELRPVGYRRSYYRSVALGPAPDRRVFICGAITGQVKLHPSASSSLIQHGEQSNTSTGRQETDSQSYHLVPPSAAVSNDQHVVSTKVGLKDHPRRSSSLRSGNRPQRQRNTRHLPTWS